MQIKSAAAVVRSQDFKQFRRKMIYSRHLTVLAFLLLSSQLWLQTLAGFHHNNQGGNSGIEMLLAAGILAKLLNKHHHGHHQSHPIPIPIPIPVHHGGGGHEVVHHGHHGHHDHHGHGSNVYYDYAGYMPYYAAAPSNYIPSYYK